MCLDGEECLLSFVKEEDFMVSIKLYILFKLFKLSLHAWLYHC